MTNPIGVYDRVGKIASKLQPEKIEIYTPHPTQRDRQIGEVVRYFTRFITHQSSADIMEISNTTYAKLKTNKLYQTTKIRWKISGKLDDEYAKLNADGTYGPLVKPTSDLTIDPTLVRLYTGVITANKLSVVLVEEEMPGIRDYIGTVDTSYMRFWKFNAHS